MSSPFDPRYERLLWAYPGDYRRRHGTEIATVLMEMADNGEPVERLPLLLGGIRQRFRLPARRPLARLGAVLTALIIGAAGAAGGSWLSTASTASVPGEIPAAITGAHPTVQRLNSPWTGTTVFGDTVVTPAWDAATAQARLQADGWQTGAVQHPGGAAYQETDSGTTALPVRSYQFGAHRDGVELLVTAHIVDDTTGFVTTQVWARPSPLLVPLTAAGLLLGAIGGWLLAAAVAYRQREKSWTASVPAATALLLLALPAAAVYPNALKSLRPTGDGPGFAAHHIFTPGPFYPFGPAWLIPALSITGVLTGAIALALTHVRRPPAAASVPAARWDDGQAA